MTTYTYPKFKNIGNTAGYNKYTIGTLPKTPTNELIISRINPSSAVGGTYYIGTIPFQEYGGSSRFLIPYIEGNTISILETGFTYGNDLPAANINLECGILERR
jgi:hypothetical protein